MVDRSLIPFLGDKTVRQRLHELDKELVSLIAIIGIGFSKFFESWVRIAMEHYPVVLWGLDITGPVWWAIYVTFWVTVFVVEADKKLKRGADAATDAVEEAAEQVSDVVTEEEE